MKPISLFLKRKKFSVGLLTTTSLLLMFFNNCSRTSLLKGNTSAGIANNPSLSPEGSPPPDSYVGPSPALSIDFNSEQPVAKIDGTVATSLFKFARGTVGSYFDSDGILRYASVNVPRVSFEPNECENSGDSLFSNCKRKLNGILIEETRINKIKYSNDFLKWSFGTNTTIIQNAGLAPDGTQTASRLQMDNQTETFLKFIGLTQGKQYTASIFAKASGKNQLAFFLNGNVVNTKVFELNNLWQRLTWTFTAETANCDFQLSNDGTVGNQVDALIWGAQIEEGLFATSFIPTAGMESMRDADKPMVTDLSWYNPSEGSWLIEWQGPKGSTSFDQILFSITSSEANDNTQTIGRRAGQQGSSYQANVPGQLDMNLRTSELPLPWQSNKIQRITLGTYSSSQMSITETDGISTPTTSKAISGLSANYSSLGIGYGVQTNSGFVNGYIKKFYYYRKQIDLKSTFGLNLPTSSAGLVFTENFSQMNGSGCLQDGQDFGSWTSISSGFGCTSLVTLPEGKAIYLNPAPSISITDKNTGFILGPHFSGSITFKANVRVLSQLRTNAVPNTWDSLWMLWNYTDNAHYYYFIPKTNGWELSKADPAYTTGQRLLAGGASPSYAIGQWLEITIIQNANTIHVSVNGQSIITVTDNERPMTNGKIGFFSEAASTHLKSINVSSL